jgi:hypothetical protein
MNNEASVSPNAILRVVSAVAGDCRIKSASCYEDPNLVVTATRRGKADKRQRHLEMVLTIGKPNYRGRAFVKECQMAGEPFPVKKAQVRWMKGKRPAPVK